MACTYVPATNGRGPDLGRIPDRVPFILSSLRLNRMLDIILIYFASFRLDLRRFLDEADLNHDGLVTFQEQGPENALISLI